MLDKSFRLWYDYITEANDMKGRTMQTYIVHYTRIDPVYGRGWVIVSHKRISAMRKIKATTMEAAQQKVIDSILKDRPQSIVEFVSQMVVAC